jgi:hypothetical protein
MMAARPTSAKHDDRYDPSHDSVRAAGALSGGQVLAWRGDERFPFCGTAKAAPLGGAFALPSAPDTLYLHDVAVAPRAVAGTCGACDARPVIRRRRRGLK